MLETGDVFDQLAFLAMKPKDLISVIATDAQRKAPWPTEQHIEPIVAGLVARYGGRLGGMTRKNLINAVKKEIIRRLRKEAAKEGKVLYFYRQIF